MESGPAEDIEAAMHAAMDLLKEHPLVFTGLAGLIALIWAICEWFSPIPYDADPSSKSDKHFAWGVILVFGIVGALAKLSAIYLLAMVWVFIFGGSAGSIGLEIFAAFYAGWIASAVSKTQARHLKKPSLIQTVCTVVVFMLALQFWSWLITALLESEPATSSIEWNYWDLLEPSFCILGLVFGWRIPSIPILKSKLQ